MKTLDEVIEQHEYCLAIGESACGGCRYRDEDGVCRMRENALPYLKQYRSDKAMWEADRNWYQGFVDSYIKSRDKHQTAVIELKHKEKEVNDILTDYVALKQYWAEQQENPPLTWDELKSMEGKPVWVEALLYKQWAVIAYVGSDYIRFEGANLYAPESRQYMGADDGWQAYRKERE